MMTRDKNNNNLFSSHSNETLQDLWTHYNNDEIILLFEETDNKNYWSREAIMDAYHFSPNYPPIRRVNSTRTDLMGKFNVEKLPSFVFLERTGKSEVYPIKSDRKYMAKIMRKFFYSDNDVENTFETKFGHSSKQPEQIDSFDDKKPRKDQVYMADLEGALFYAFGHEASIHKLIAGKELAALKKFIVVLDEYFPARPGMKEAISTLRLKLDKYKKQISGEEFSHLWTGALNGKDAVQEWVGCRGSRPHLRGYPCSIWTTFHTLTVSYATREPVNSPTEPDLILQAMKGFIKYFFGCAHCSNHFVDMAEDEINPIESVKTPRQAVLWLWAAHNKVDRYSIQLLLFI